MGINEEEWIVTNIFFYNFLKIQVTNYGSFEEMKGTSAIHGTLASVELKKCENRDDIDFLQMNGYVPCGIISIYMVWRKPERTTDHGQATGKLYHLRLRVECAFVCYLQSRAQTHAVLVIGTA
jgi:hypothetical protein